MCGKAMKSIFPALLTALACGLCMACQTRPAPPYADIGEEGWDCSRRLEMPAPPSHGAWKSLHVRTSRDYPYRQLAVELRHAAGCDTLLLSLLPPHGTDLRATQAPLPRPVGSALSIRHLMPAELLPGVCSIGVE